MGRGDLTDAEWERLRPFLPVSNRRCGRWRDHRQGINGIPHRVRTGVHWRDRPERFGPWKTVYERHRLWSADGTWERLLQRIQCVVASARFTFMLPLRDEGSQTVPRVRELIYTVQAMPLLERTRPWLTRKP